MARNNLFAYFSVEPKKKTANYSMNLTRSKSLLPEKERKFGRTYVYVIDDSGDEGETLDIQFEDDESEEEADAQGSQ